jgi:hypothetical protein
VSFRVRSKRAFSIPKRTRRISLTLSGFSSGGVRYNGFTREVKVR